MTRTHGPPSATKSELEMLRTTFGLGKTAAGRYTFAHSIGYAGIAITSVNGGRGTLMADRA